VLDQKVTLDLGWNVWFSGGFAIQLNFAEIVSIDKQSVKRRSHNFELYFEEDEFDVFLEKLKSFDNIVYVHSPKKHAWQQRVVRIYDPDEHIIEIGEAMVVVAKRFLNQGFSVEETAKIIQHPVEFVRKVQATNGGDVGM
jgi:hypothetical protein